jgi:hypothetical protein
MKEESEVYPPILIISGGVGASGEQVVHTVLAQFPDASVPVRTIGNVRTIEQIERAVAEDQVTGGTLVHTLVFGELRQALIERAQAAKVPDIDLMGPLLERLTQVIGRPPLGRPGLYRQLRRDYYERVAAIDFAMLHDDGMRPEGWREAEIVLVGVSRVGKTPLSFYLAVLGWKVANIPLVPGASPQPDLFHLDRRRVFGLTIQPGQLLMHRRARQARLGAPGYSEYTDPQAIYAELQAAEELFHQAGFAVVDVTDKPIEVGADEIIRLLTERLR